MRGRLQALLTHPRAPWLAALVGVLLCVPALFAGLVGDDYLWWVQLQGEGPMGQGLPAVLHMYNFIPGGLPMEVLKGQGMVTWWADPDMSIALLRPISVLTHVFDHAIAPRGFVLQHAHSLLWYALSILVTAATYRRIHPSAGAVVGLAALLFAVDDAHAMNVGWLANRHALISMVVGGLAFLAHLRWRSSAQHRWLVAALLAMTVGLFCGEATLGAAAYLVAWQLTLDRGGWGRRLAGIAPYAALVVAWRLLYNALGYGIKGSGLYLDPGYDPLGFSLALLRRWPQLLSGQWFQVPVDAIMFLPLRFGYALTGVAVVCCALLLWYLWPTLRRSAEARFWALGMGLATVPLAAAFAMDRLLAFTGVGAFALLALQAQAAGWLGGGEPRIGRPRRWLTGGLLLMHLPLAALLLLARTGTLPIFGEIFRGGADSLPDDPVIEDQLVIYVTGHEFPTAYTPLVRQVEGKPVPARVALLSPFNDHHTVLREDADTLTMSMPGGWVAIVVNQLERRVGLGFELGEMFEMPDFTAEIREINAARDATTVAFHFERPLEDPGYRWLAWSAHRAVPWTPPPIGETVELPVLDASSFFPAPEVEVSVSPPRPSPPQPVTSLGAGPFTPGEILGLAPAQADPQAPLQAAYPPDKLERMVSPSLDVNKRPDEIISLLGVTPGMVVADVGAGPGYHTLHWAEAVGPTGQVWATDIQLDALQQLQRRAREHGADNIYMVLHSHDAVLLPASGVELVFMSQVHCWPHSTRLPPEPDPPAEAAARERLFASIHTGLQPGGRLAIVQADERFPGGFTAAGITRFLEGAGFRLVATHAIFSEDSFLVYERVD